jgi:uncharacterized NAD(P)/FAD-binding protein YdhS
MTRLVVVGGGASGVLTAAAASRHDSIEEIVLVERSDRVGPGLAYGTAAPHHRLNSPASRMGAWQDEPGDFVRWSAGTATPQQDADFSPRRLYGAYLEAVLDALPRVVVQRGEAIDVTEDGAAVRVVLADGRSIGADAGVLALGNPPPPGRTVAATAVVPDPWLPGALDGVHGRVLLLGTGLTMVDVATSLARADPAIELHATSRNLLLPRVHLDAPQPPGPGIEGHPTSLPDVIRGFRARLRAADAAGSAWQAEVDGVRPQVNRLWSALPADDRVRFVRHVSRRWEVHRHRMSPAVAAELQSLLDTGRLVLGAPSGQYDRVVDCTGPRPFAQAGWNPVVDALLTAGTARADPLGIGLDVDSGGRLIAASGAPSERLSVVGPARRGTQWESTAIPEIRQHATEVAAQIAALH